MRRYRGDDNDEDIIKAWRAMGWCVKDYGQFGLGFDAIGIKQGRVVFAEIKDGRKPPSARKMTDKEIETAEEFGRFGAPILLFEKVEDLMQLDADARRAHEPGYRGRNYYP
jgi:hypothetical protein